MNRDKTFKELTCSVNTPILTTKLFIPPVRSDYLPRPHLIEKLNASIAYPLTLISASAGSGKTTLLSEWVVQIDCPAAWISLDPSDNDPAQFLTYFISALQTIQEGCGEEVSEILHSSQTIPFETILINLINEVADFPDRFTLVFDDYHAITNQQINALVAFMIENLPPQMHLIIACRIDPPWPLARYRARNQLLEIRGQDLRFSFNEATKFLNRTTGVNLSVEDVKALEERTEGWIAGLQLAALSMKGRNDVSEFVKAFTGSHVYVAEYLLEEILKEQSEDIQSFLLKTSLLERMNADLCEAVSGCKDGQVILADLHQANVFVIPLDNEGEWFRYHHLFSDLLRSRLPQALQPGAITELHERASRWYENHGHVFEAINHALAANNFDRVADLVKQYAYSLIFSGRVNILREWLEALPQELLYTNPYLSFYQFWIDILQSRADLSESAIQEQEDLLRTLPPTPENDRLRGELMSVVCRAVALSGRTSEGIRLAQEALAYLPPDNPASRARAYSAIATAHDLEGRVEEAELAYKESFSQAMEAGEYRLAAHTLMVKGLIQCQYGHLHEAAKTFQTIVDMGNRVDIPLENKQIANLSKISKVNKVFFPAGQGYIGLGIIHLEWNDLKTAENYLEQGMELCRQGGLDGIFIGHIQMSRLHQAKGDLEGALQAIQMPKQAQRVDDFNIATRQIQIALAKGDADSAWHWAAPLTKMPSSDRTPMQLPLLFLEVLQAIIARVYLAQGKTEQALYLLNQLEATAKPGKRLGRLIEVYLLRALVYQKQNMGDPDPQAIMSLKHALELGEPEGYVLLFLEEGQALIPLLDTMADHPAVPDRLIIYANTLLESFSELGKPRPFQTPSEAVDLVEQLTSREMEVLQLIAAGDSNQTIADKLVITVRTVKKHTSNIYSKLGANSRTQAVAYARKIGLLPAD